MSDQKITVVIGGDYQAGGAFSQAGSALDALAAKVGGLGGILKGIAIEETVRRLVEFGASTLEAEADLAKMSQRTGVAVEQLSEMAYAANQTGVQTDVFEKGVRKLQQTIGAAASGNQKAIDSLKAVGVSARDSSGHLTSASSALTTIAGKYSSVADGTAKAASAASVFGARMGTQLIPMLDRGKKGLEDLYSEAHRVGKVLTEEDAQSALEFEENVKKLEATGRGLMQNFLGGLLPALNNIADALTGPGAGGMNAVRDAGEALGDVIKMLVLGFESLVIGIEFCAVKLGLLADAFGAFSSGDFKGAQQAIGQFFGFLNDQASEDLALKLARIQEALFPDAAMLKKKAAAATDTIQQAAEDANKIRNQRLANEMNAEKLAADYSKSINDLQMQNLDLLYKHQLVTVQDYYARKKKLQADSLQADIYAMQQEIAIQDKAMKSSPNEVERLKALGEINRLTEQLTVAEAKLSQLRGQKAGSNEADPLLQQAQAMEIYAAQAQQLAQQIDQVFSQLKEDEEAVTSAVDNYQITAITGEQKTNELRQIAHDKLQSMIADYRGLAAAAGDPKLIDNGNKYGKQLDQLSVKVDSLKKEFISATTDGLAGFFTEFMTGSKGAAAAFADFAKSILAEMDRIIAKMIAVWIMKKILGWATGSAASGSDGGGLSDSTLAGTGAEDGPPTFFAAGGRMSAGQIGIVGDGGEPELWVPDTAGSVVPFSKLGAAGGGMTNITYDFRGADPGSEARIMQQIRQSAIWARSGAVNDVRENRLRGKMA